MSRVRTPGDGPKCQICGKPAVWGGYCQMKDGKGYCDSAPRASSVRYLICKLFGHLDIIHGYSTNTGGFIQTRTTHYHCETCGRLRHEVTMTRTLSVRRWKPATQPGMAECAGEEMR